MKQQDITFEEKIGELLLEVPHPNRRGQVFILVEGESDVRLFRKLFAADHLNVERIPGGKFKLEEGVATLLDKSELIIGVRDADFIKLSEQGYDKPNMFLTDYHDIEMVLLADEEVFSAFVAEYTALSKSQHQALRDDMLHTIRYLGYLKWLNEREKLKLSFEAGFLDLLDFDRKALDLTKHILRVISKTKNKTGVTGFDAAALEKKVLKLEEEKPELLQLTSGHDLLRAFAEYFNKKWNHKDLKEKVLVMGVRMSFRMASFEKTDLYKEIKQWFDEHQIDIH